MTSITSKKVHIKPVDNFIGFKEINGLQNTDRYMAMIKNA